MGLNETASADRLHRGFFGKRNAGKSSLVNAVTGQETSVVSEVKGTTTDPVRKAMELLPLGPVVIIDTPGLDDEGELGELRVKRTRQVLNYVDLAVLTVDATIGMSDAERELCEIFKKKNIPYVIAYNKSDLLATIPQASENEIYVSALSGVNINELKDKMAALVKASDEQIDKAAPKGRLILPQQQTIRDILDSGATALVCRDTELQGLLASLPQKPRMVITDSQAFGKVAKIVPRDVELTSFSILFARYKGNLRDAVRGAAMLDKLQDGDKILISEGCTHHRQCGDIGTVKLPKWISEYTGKQLGFEFTSGRDFPEDLSPYALVIHCGGCMLTEREMQYRARHASDSGIPMSNYGIIIAHTHGILRRSLESFKDILNELN